jgi:nucleotide-binding universal stress UspA family protein
MYKKILVATDGSTLSKKAISNAVALAEIHGANLIAIQVIPRFTQTYFEGSIPVNMVEVDKIEKSWADHAHKQLDKVAKDAKAKQVAVKTVVVKSDSVSDALVTAAKKNKVNLIVMASHGRKGIKRLLLGSETQQVLTHTTIPVLVVR